MDYFTKDGRPITFDVHPFAEDSDPRGYVVHHIYAIVDGKRAGYIKLSYIPKDRWDKAFPTVWHFRRRQLGHGDIPESILGNWKAMLKHIGESYSWTDPQFYLESAIAKATKEYSQMKGWVVDKPIVDFISTDQGGLQKQGVAVALHLFASEWLKKEFGLRLWFSTLMTPAGRRFYDKFKPTVPKEKSLVYPRLNDVKYREYMSRVAARPIQIDRASLMQSVKRLQNFLSTGYWGRNQGEQIGSRLGFKDSVSVRGTNGSVFDVEVQYRSRSDPSVADLALGGGSGHITNTKKPAVVVLLNGVYTPAAFASTQSSSRSAQEIFEMLAHEITHQSDSFKIETQETTQEVKKENEIDPIEYYNDPAEVKAFMRSIFEEVYKYLPKMLKVFSLNRCIQIGFRDSETWNRIKKHLTEQNKKTIMNGVYRAVSDQLNQDGVGKAASELIRLAKEIVDGV